MSASKVFFTDFRCRLGVSQLDKLRKLLEKSEFSKIDFDGKFVAIKLHFGELGNLSFLRANYAKVVADFVKERGGKPFLTDCNTLYVGSRKNALEHMDTAYLNGYSPFSTGCHVIIADGLKGSDDIEVPVVGGEYCKTARIGRAVMDADIFISLAHFKGHEHAGFGGALKNIGMGCGSRAGKMAMHADGKPYVQTDLCVGCGACAKICAHNGPQIADKKCHIDHDACAGCGRCIAICPKDAIRPGLDSSEKILNCKITEYAKAKHDKRPDQRGIRQADGQEHAEGLSDALDVFRAVVIAQDRLRALRDPLQGQERKLHDAREDGHGADGDIAAVAGQRGIEADGEHALARLHDKRRRAEAHAGQDEPRALQEVLHAQLQDAFFAEQEQHDPQARHAL